MLPTSINETWSGLVPELPRLLSGIWQVQLLSPYCPAKCPKYEIELDVIV